MIEETQEDSEYIPIETLDVSVRAYNILKRAGINSVDELSAIGEEELGSLPRMDARCLREIREKMDCFKSCSGTGCNDHDTQEKGREQGENRVDVFICPQCGYEDSSGIPGFGRDGVVACPACGKEGIAVSENIREMAFPGVMGLKEWVELLAYIDENHSFARGKGKRIKYISSTFDFRSRGIFYVKLDGKEFSKTNSDRHRNLTEWIREWLDK